MWTKPIFLMVLSWSSTGAPESLEALMAQLKAVSGFQARFVETKRMALLAEPLVSKGDIYFQSPDHLARVLEGIPATRVVVTPRRVSTVRGTRVEQLEFGAHPEVEALVTSLLSLLRGDLPALQRFYSCRFDRKAGGAWRLRLTPRSKRLAAIVRGLDFEGERTVLERFTVHEASGDTSVTEIADIDINRTFSTAETDRIFRTP